MNDPGLENPIADSAGAVEEEHGDAVPDVFHEDEDTQAYLQPTRWWYTSTAFPMIAGTFGPMANSFSICALVQYWRVEIPPGGTEEHGIDIKDPTWLLAVNAVSLAFALAANISLSLNMARRVSFSVAQPITIVGYWIASILLIVLIALAAHDLKDPDVQSQALSQAYYYAIFAAGIYQVISYLMCITVWGAYRGHYSKEFKLTMSQRTLMLQTISFMVYILAGAAVFSHIEQWKYLDAVYWADFTCLTIGIGDYAPMTKLGRGLLFPYAIGGVVSLGLVVGSIRSLALDRGKKKLRARMTEKTRRSIVKRVSTLKEGSVKAKLRGLDRKVFHALDLNPAEKREEEISRREAEFEAMRAVQDLSARKRKWISLCISGGVFLVLWLLGAQVFHKTEKNQSWSYFDGLYFAYTTLLTIGYGDLSPMSNSGKPFFVLWTLLAVPSLTILISHLGDTVVKSIKDMTLYLGEVTFLPGDQGGTAERLKYGASKLTHGKFGTAVTNEKQPVRKGMPGKNQSQSETSQDGDVSLAAGEKRGRSPPNGQASHDRVAPDPRRNPHHHHHVLATEIKELYSHVSSKTNKKFTYTEWTYYLRLLGQDEHDGSLHRPAAAKAVRAEEAAEASKEEGAVIRRDPEWSWLGDRNPLIGEKDEAEWLLERLLKVLERKLKEHADQTHHEKGD